MSAIKVAAGKDASKQCPGNKSVRAGHVLISRLGISEELELSILATVEIDLSLHLADHCKSLGMVKCGH